MTKLDQIENEIDAAFAKNGLVNLAYPQAMWTLLSFLEDLNLKNTVIHPMSVEHLQESTDMLINCVTHPLRVLHQRNNEAITPLKKELIDEHYELAYEWMNLAQHYNQYCSIFPLLRRQKLTFAIEGNMLNVDSWKNGGKEYEAYNRIFQKKGIASEKYLDQNQVISTLMRAVSIGKKNDFEFHPNPKIAKLLIDIVSEYSNDRYDLPDDWKGKYFTFGAYKKIFTLIQALLYGRYVIRVKLASDGLIGCGYTSSIWVVSKIELINRLTRYSGFNAILVNKIIEYLTFGKVGICNPDVATQPLIDLRNGFLALSPFLFMNSNVERNLCVLLNQIGEEKEIYSHLTNQKEEILRREIELKIKALGYETKYGDIGVTDVDIAIINHDEKICLCLELKWFIEPAEIREINDRSKDIEKGIKQAKILLKKFRDGDNQLIDQVLKISKNYTFLAAVGSVNWIGYSEIQDLEVPVVKVDHLLDKLKQVGSLELIVDWLKNRNYLPVPGVDYDVKPIKISVGSWSSTWYSFLPLQIRS